MDFSTLRFGANVTTNNGTPMVVVGGPNPYPYVTFELWNKYDEGIYYYRADGSVYSPLPAVVSVNHKLYNTAKKPQLLEKWKHDMQLKEIIYNPSK